MSYVRYDDENKCPKCGAYLDDGYYGHSCDFPKINTSLNTQSNRHTTESDAYPRVRVRGVRLKVNH